MSQQLTQLKNKLGIKPTHSIALINSPDDYFSLLNIPGYANKLENTYDFIQYFTREKVELENNFNKLKSSLNKDSMLWISWPKKSSKVVTDLDENVVREIGLKKGLVDVKVASIDEIWSALKFVYRLKDR